MGESAAHVLLFTPPQPCTHTHTHMLSHVRTIRTLHPSSAEHYAAGLLPPRLPFPALSNLVLIPQPANLRASSSYLTRLAAKAAKESTARRRRRFSLLAQPLPHLVWTLPPPSPLTATFNLSLWRRNFLFTASRNQD